jgi:predicted PurR-regulated permease PerM
MARTQEQIDNALDYLETRVQSVPTQEQITTLTDSINNYQVATANLINMLVERIQALEDWKLIHEQDANAHDA